MKNFIRALCLLVIAVGAINFVTFIATSQHLGGDALNGYQANGRYYVSNHGHSTEVSPSEWQKNRFQAISVFATHPLAIAAMFYLLFSDLFPKMIFRGRAEERERKEQEVRASHTPQVSFSCGGKIGLLNFGGPLLKVTVYPQGLHCKPLFMPAFGILSTEIKSVNLQNSFLWKRVNIVHISSEVASPLFLYCHNNEAAIAALTSLNA